MGPGLGPEREQLHRRQVAQVRGRPGTATAPAPGGDPWPGRRWRCCAARRRRSGGRPPRRPGTRRAPRSSPRRPARAGRRWCCRTRPRCRSARRPRSRTAGPRATACRPARDRSPCSQSSSVVVRAVRAARPTSARAPALVEVHLGAQVAGGVDGAEPAVARQRRTLLDPGERVRPRRCRPAGGLRPSSPAEVPIIVSASRTSMPPSRRPMMMPASHAMPVAPPPASTKARSSPSRRRLPLVEPVARHDGSRVVVGRSVDVDHVLAHHPIVSSKRCPRHRAVSVLTRRGPAGQVGTGWWQPAVRVGSCWVRGPAVGQGGNHCRLGLPAAQRRRSLPPGAWPRPARPGRRRRSVGAALCQGGSRSVCRCCPRQGGSRRQQRLPLPELRRGSRRQWRLRPLGRRLRAGSTRTASIGTLTSSSSSTRTWQRTAPTSSTSPPAPATGRPTPRRGHRRAGSP